MTGLLGGAFNPPHNGHVALARTATKHFGLDGLVVLVSVRPGHKEVQLDADTRLRLAQAAFPDARVELDPYARTVDLLKERKWDDPLFVIGADQFAEFLTWKEPEGVLARSRIAVATRPGYQREELEEIKNQLEHGDRVEFFELDPVPISSRDIRGRVARGEPIAGLVPGAVAELISALGLYRNGGYTEANPEQELTQS